MSIVPVLTIDGPVGSGKGTIARRVAQSLGWNLLDSGALYRLVALAAASKGIDLGDVAALAALAAGLDVNFGSDDAGDERIMLDGEDVTASIRTEECGAGASAVAALQPVRDALLSLQRGFRRPPGLVADGRDMGTVIFTDAPLKIFLTASAEERAQRRYKQLLAKGESVNLAALLEEIRLRDERDMNRAVAPLRPADDAQVLDTTGMSIVDVFQHVLAAVVQAGLASSGSSQ